MVDLAKLHRKNVFSIAKFQHFLAAFALMDCQSGSNVATCYDHNSKDLVSYTAQSLSIGEQSFGEVLRLHNIDKFCCCKGDYCKDFEKFRHSKVRNRLSDSENRLLDPENRLLV